MSGSIRNRGYICRFFSMIRAVSYLSEVNSCSFVQPVHILHLVVTLGCFRGRKKKQRSICFQAAWMVHCFAPVSHFSFWRGRYEHFRFPFAFCMTRLYAAYMWRCISQPFYYSYTFLLFIYLFIIHIPFYFNCGRVQTAIVE